MDDLETFRETCCKEGVLKIHARYLRRVIREAPSSLIIKSLRLRCIVIFTYRALCVDVSNYILLHMARAS